MKKEILLFVLFFGVIGGGIYAIAHVVTTQFVAALTAAEISYSETYLR